MSATAKGRVHVSGVLEGLRVLDLSWGIAGPMTTMLLADHGADVIRIEPPGGAPFEEPEGYRVWNRGKRSAVLDLKDDGDRRTFLDLARAADIVLETYAPGVAERLGIGYDVLRELNPRLIYCAITGYGRDTRDADRPAFDQLVAARTGYQWEARGWHGSPMDHIVGRDDVEPGVKVPDEIRIGSDRDGPIFTATAAPSVATAYLTTVAVSAALHAREVTGVGQRVDTSMLQAILQFGATLFQRPEHPDAPGYQMGTVDRRQTWGILPAKDGWVCMWGPPPAWPMTAAEGDALRVPDPQEVMERAKAAPGGPRPADNANRLRGLAEAAPYTKKFTVAEWTELAHKASFSMHPIRTPEEALCDPLSFADGSVAEVDDPELGTLREVGIVHRLHNRPTRPRGSAPTRGQHTEEIRQLAASAPATVAAAPTGRTLSRGPLDGVRVLDFSFAVAGPWITQVLSDLGADVIKIDGSVGRGGWGLNHMGMGVNKSKRHIVLDAKNPAARPALEALIRSVDVVSHNMKPGAAERLRIDYESLKQINPQLIYCHTRAFEDGPRSDRGGHDQAGNSLGGTVWEDGGMWNGGRPYFHVGTGGDMGNGYLGAIAILQALYDRDRTGEGQKVDTSILNAALFVNSRVFTTPDGRSFDREKLDANQTGFSALYRLYECSDNWICLAVLSDRHWAALVEALPSLADDDRFRTAVGRKEHDAALASLLEGVFKERAADEWFKLLDATGVPCEVSSNTYTKTMFDDPDLIERGWVVHTEGHPTVGAIDMAGIGIDYSATPSVSGGPPAVPGQHTREILQEIGLSEQEIQALVDAGAAHIA
jgi:crotonobetainyl-CoA:carnitine CoA-transferase CaiB-like acyl-CoA transferase